MDGLKISYRELFKTIGWPGNMFHMLGLPLNHTHYSIEFKSHDSKIRMIGYILRIILTAGIGFLFVYYYVKYLIEDSKFAVSKMVHVTFVATRLMALIFTNFLWLEYELAELLVKAHDEVDLNILSTGRNEELRILSREYLKALIDVIVVIFIKIINFDYTGFFDVYLMSKGERYLLMFVTCYGDYSDTYVYRLFTTYLSILRRRFEAINCSLEQLAEAQCRGNDYEKYCSTKLYLLYRVHLKYCKITKQLNALFGSILIYYMVGSTAMLFFKCLQVYLHFSREGMNWDAVRGILFVLEIFREFLRVVTVCSTTCQHANSTAKILHNFRNKWRNKDLESQIQMYSLQLIHQRISITLNGYLVIDFSLLYMIMGMIASYLVILIQYEHGSSGMVPAASTVPN